MYSEYTSARGCARLDSYPPGPIGYAQSTPPEYTSRSGVYSANTRCIRRIPGAFGRVFGSPGVFGYRVYISGRRLRTNAAWRARLSRPIDGRARSRSTRTNTEYTSAKTLYLCLEVTSAVIDKSAVRYAGGRMLPLHCYCYYFGSIPTYSVTC